MIRVGRAGRILASLAAGLVAWEGLTPKAPVEAQQAPQDRFDRLIEPTPVDVRADLNRLASSQRLLQRDQQGTTLLERLDQLQQQPMAEGLDRQQIFREVVAQVSRPGSTRQGHRATCITANLEYLHVKDNPADYVRVMAGLTSPQGHVVAANGQTLEREYGLIVADDSGRTAAGRLYQGSLMEHLNGPLDYRNGSDRSYGSDGSVHLGLTPSQWAQGVTMVLPPTAPAQAVVAGSSHSRQQVVGMLQEWPSVPVLVRWNRERGGGYVLHSLTVEGTDSAGVMVRNPQGYRDQGRRQSTADTAPSRTLLPAPTPDPPGGLASGGYVRIPHQDFWPRLLYHPRLQDQP